MRKSKTMRAAMILLVLVLITSCFVGSTFAKYVATASSTANARVAYWGFESPTSVAFDLFDVTDDTGIIKEVGKIAPGSSNEVTFKFVSAKKTDVAPEVAYRVRIDTNNSVPPSYSYGGGLEGVIIWYITKDGVTSEYATWKDFTKAIGALDGDGGSSTGWANYAPGQELPDILKGDEVTIGWRWPFEKQVTGGNGLPTADAGTDATDTYIGNLGGTTAGDIKLVINMTVEQIDNYYGP